LPEKNKGHKKWVSYLYRTAQPFTLATFLSWGSSIGAGRIRLTRLQKYYFLGSKKQLIDFSWFLIKFLTFALKQTIKTRTNMETKPRSLFNNALIYGLITAAISIVFSILMYIMDVPYKSPVMYFSFVILLAGIIYGTLQYRNTYLGGYITFSKAFLSGFIIVMVAAIIAAIYSYVFLTFIDPSYLERIIAQALEETETKMLEQGLSDEQIEPGLAMTRKFMSPAMMSVFSVLGSALFGAILSLLSAAFLKKEDKSFDGQFKDVQ
jgi:Protein of unknown function (DUF4199)